MNNKTSKLLKMLASRKYCSDKEYVLMDNRSTDYCYTMGIRDGKTFLARKILNLETKVKSPVKE